MYNFKTELRGGVVTTPPVWQKIHRLFGFREFQKKGFFSVKSAFLHFFCRIGLSRGLGKRGLVSPPIYPYLPTWLDHALDSDLKLKVLAKCDRTFRKIPKMRICYTMDLCYHFRSTRRSISFSLS